MTSDIQNLSFHFDYTTIDNILIENGTCLTVTHIGSSTLPFSSQSFILNNVLCVSSMKKNLILSFNFVSIIISPLNYHHLLFM